MRILASLFEKITLGTFVACFSLVALYVPQPVHAGGGGFGGALEITQIANNVLLGIQEGLQRISAVANTLTSQMTASLNAKEYVLDGIAWALAKATISSMTTSIINWVNSGFKGSPAFVTDLRGTLFEVADKTFGQYLEELGGPFSFICDPFKLDVRIALAVYYEDARANEGIAGPASCTLSGALENIDDFITSTKSFTDPESGGWDAWFEITTNPTKYTPYGNLLEATSQTNARIVNAKNEQLSEIDFGQGFLSAKICETIEGPNADRERCTITTPGKVINEALTFQTSSGPRSLIEADEFNEILAALFSKLAQKAITGAFGLLGLSSGTGYTDTSSGGTSFLDQLEDEGLVSDPDQIGTLISDALAVETWYEEEANYYLPLLEEFADDLDNQASKRDAARAEAEKIPGLLVAIAYNIAELEALETAFAAPDRNLQDIISRFNKLSLHSRIEVEGNVRLWQSLID